MIRKHIQPDMLAMTLDSMVRSEISEGRLHLQDLRHRKVDGQLGLQNRMGCHRDPHLPSTPDGEARFIEEVFRVMR